MTLPAGEKMSSTDDELVKGLRELECHEAADRIVALTAERDEARGSEQAAKATAENQTATTKYWYGRAKEAEFRANAAERERDDLTHRLDDLTRLLRPFIDAAELLPDPRVISEAHPEWERCLRRFKIAVEALTVRDFRALATLTTEPRS